MTPLRGRVLVAYLILSVVWGSTFLAIRIGVGHTPPALFAGTRFFLAGVVLLVLVLALGHPLPRSAGDWRTTALMGVLLLSAGNGLVVWAEQYVNSMTAAIFIVTSPLWMALFDAVLPGGDTRPGAVQVAGLIVGFVGALLLVGGSPAALRAADWRGPIALIAGTMTWALGSVYSKRHPLEGSTYASAALQMVIGGLVLLAAGLASGEGRDFHPSLPAALAVLYLIVFGSLVGYSCFLYVLKHTSPVVTATYTYVNTVVAVLLGWALLGEQVTARTFLAMGIVLGSVIWVQRAGGVKREE